MAALTITAANVVQGSGAKTKHGLAGVSITAGQAVYLDTTTGKYGLCDADHAAAMNRTLAGLALHAAAANQPLEIQTDGQITIGATVAPGVPYFTSATAGGIAPVADNTTGVYPTLVGFGISATVIDINMVAAGVAVG